METGEKRATPSLKSCTSLANIYFTNTETPFSCHLKKFICNSTHALQAKFAKVLKG